MRAIGALSTNAGADHIRRLQARGFLASVVHGRWGERRLTASGLRAIGLAECYHCQGRGTTAIPPRAARDARLVHRFAGTGPLCGASMACASTENNQDVNCGRCRRRMGMAALGASLAPA